MKPSTSFSVPYSIHIADREVHDSHPHGVENYSVREIIQKSSNVGAVKIGQLMGEDGMYKWIKAYGFGEPTGVEFPVDSGGIVAPVDQWSGSSIGNIPMGQGIAVTALQMASAFSTVANNGCAGAAAARRAGRRPSGRDQGRRQAPRHPGQGRTAGSQHAAAGGR